MLSCCRTDDAYQSVGTSEKPAPTVTQVDSSCLTPTQIAVTSIVLALLIGGATYCCHHFEAGSIATIAVPTAGGVGLLVFIAVSSCKSSSPSQETATGSQPPISEPEAAGAAAPAQAVAQAGAPNTAAPAPQKSAAEIAAEEAAAAKATADAAAVAQAAAEAQAQRDAQATADAARAEAQAKATADAAAAARVAEEEAAAKAAAEAEAQRNARVTEEAAAAAKATADAAAAAKAAAEAADAAAKAAAEAAAEAERQRAQSAVPNPDAHVDLPAPPAAAAAPAAPAQSPAAAAAATVAEPLTPTALTAAFNASADLAAFKAQLAPQTLETLTLKQLGGLLMVMVKAIGKEDIKAEVIRLAAAKAKPNEMIVAINIVITQNNQSMALQMLNAYSSFNAPTLNDHLRDPNGNLSTILDEAQSANFLELATALQAKGAKKYAELQADKLIATYKQTLTLALFTQTLAPLTLNTISGLTAAYFVLKLCKLTPAEAKPDLTNAILEIIIPRLPPNEVVRCARIATTEKNETMATKIVGLAPPGFASKIASPFVASKPNDTLLSVVSGANMPNLLAKLEALAATAPAAVASPAKGPGGAAAAALSPVRDPNAKTPEAVASPTPAGTAAAGAGAAAPAANPNG